MWRAPGCIGLIIGGGITNQLFARKEAPQPG
ncbi:hypothetical protein SAMN05519105_1944 [Rhodobacter sp. 24-YEA-8]|nr:hypothetical protein SAMN05519105_1944 [Rhodobacter sp. 24-YEA-8]